MRVLLDVNVLLAYGWKHHPDHQAVSDWIDNLEGYALCPITELGFIRISMSPAFRARHESALQILAYMRSQADVADLTCDLSASAMPSVGRYKDTTDAYLVTLAKHHGHQFATLDEGIMAQPWATDVAFNPITPS